MFYQNQLIEVKFIVLGRICEKWPCLYISMCICISDVQYIYIYIHAYIHTCNHTVCMHASGFQEMNCQYFCFLFALIFVSLGILESKGQSFSLDCFWGSYSFIQRFWVWYFRTTRLVFPFFLSFFIFSLGSRTNHGLVFPIQTLARFQN